MLHIKYRVDKTENGEAGLFCGEKIEKGRLVCSAGPGMDVDIPTEEFDRMDENAQAEIRKWGFLLEPEGVWHVDFDISRFVRHSFEPNLIQDPGHKEMYLIAGRDIAEGEELTVNYLGEEEIKRVENN